MWFIIYAMQWNDSMKRMNNKNEKKVTVKNWLQT